MKFGARTLIVLACLLAGTAAGCDSVKRESDPDATNPPVTLSREDLNDLNK